MSCSKTLEVRSCSDGDRFHHTGMFGRFPAVASAKMSRCKQPPEGYLHWYELRVVHYWCDGFPSRLLFLDRLMQAQRRCRWSRAERPRPSAWRTCRHAHRPISMSAYLVLWIGTTSLLQKLSLSKRGDGAFDRMSRELFHRFSLGREADELRLIRTVVLEPNTVAQPRPQRSFSRSIISICRRSRILWLVGARDTQHPHLHRIEMASLCLKRFP